MLLPSVHGGAALPCRFDHPGDSPVAPRQGGFQESLVGPAPANLYLASPQLILQVIEFPFQLRFRILGHPLERRMCLGNEGGYVDRDSCLAGSLTGNGFDKLYYPIEVFIRFRRQSYHEIEFHRLPTVTEHPSGSLKDLLVGKVLVDNFPQALGTGFRSDRKTGSAYPLDLLGDRWRQSTDAHGGERHGHTVLTIAIHNGLEDIIEGTVIPDAETGESEILVTGELKSLLHRLQHGPGFPFTGGSIDHPRVTEPAASGAPTCSLYIDPVVNGGKERHDEGGGWQRHIQ